MLKGVLLTLVFIVWPRDDLYSLNTPLLMSFEQYLIDNWYIFAASFLIEAISVNEVLLKGVTKGIQFSTCFQSELLTTS